MNDDKSFIIRFLDENNLPKFVKGEIVIQTSDEKVFFTIQYLNHKALLCANKDGVVSYTDALNMAQ